MLETSIDVQRCIHQRVKDIGANESLAVNGSVTPVSFFAKPDAGKKWHIHGISIYLEGATNFDALLFGSITALTNGVQIKINDVVLNTWKTTTDIATQVSDLLPVEALGKTGKALLGKCDVPKQTGFPILVDDRGIEFLVQDDLSLLTNFIITIHGHEA